MRHTDILLAPVAVKVLKMMTGKTQKGKSETEKNVQPVVLPYIHRVQHSMRKKKEIASRHDIPVVFTAPKKLLGLCEKVNSEEGTFSGPRCTIKHNDSEVVYRTSLSCGMQHVGGTNW